MDENEKNEPVDIRKNRERVLKRKFDKLVAEARTADGQWLTEELERQLERQRLKQAGLLADPTAEIYDFKPGDEP